MSDLYVQKNNESSLTIFNKRLIYNFDSQNEDYKNLIDFNFGEKYLYGRVSRDYQPIVLGSPDRRLKAITSKGVQTDTPRALNFVVDMFERLKTQFDKNIADGKLSGDDPFLSSLKIYKGYQDPTELHTSYLNT